MPKTSKFQSAKPIIESFFNNYKRRSFNLENLNEIFLANRRSWHLPQSFSFTNFMESLLKHSKLKETKFRCRKYHKTLIRYAWEEIPSIYEMALLIKPKAFFSHYTALVLHKLTTHAQKNIYLNAEQSQKPSNLKSLEQGRIDFAFKGKPRTTQYIFKFGEFNIHCLNGKHTGNLGVNAIKISDLHSIPVSNIERTLIDISVRPVYSGGTHEVLSAFKNAKGKFLVENLAENLKQFKHTYPYHQSIGFYLERAGYSESELRIFQKIKMEFNFYLDYGITKKSYSKKWKLYYPEGF